MNYLAHSHLFLDDPYMVAGTNVPDWLNVVDRKVRVRSKQARELVEDDDLATARTAAGIVQHHWDDQWFHTTAAFQTLSLSFSVEIRERLVDTAGMRAGFLGHILVEILLDWVLSESKPGLLDEYYAVLTHIEPEHVQRTVNRISKVQTQRLSMLIPRMITEGFLYDYADDKKLMIRLNQVMRRVKLPDLPSELSEFFPIAREKVYQHQHELLAGPPEHQTGSESDATSGDH